jgi:hypothetical protein
MPACSAASFRTRRGLLDMEYSDCCDMSGAIAFFEAIDPRSSPARSATPTTSSGAGSGSLLAPTFGGL